MLMNQNAVNAILFCCLLVSFWILRTLWMDRLTLGPQNGGLTEENGGIQTFQDELIADFLICLTARVNW